MLSSGFAGAVLGIVAGYMSIHVLKAVSDRIKLLSPSISEFIHNLYAKNTVPPSNLYH